MLNDRTHDEPEWDGRPIFIVETNEAISRKLLGITFVRGIARCTDAARAMRFDEEFGFLVTRATGQPKWKLARHPEVVTAEEYDELEIDSKAVLQDDRY